MWKSSYEGCVRFAIAFAYERVKTHMKIIYELAFHSFITDMALSIACCFLREITAGSFSLEACQFNLIWKSASKISIVDSN